MIAMKFREDEIFLLNLLMDEGIKECERTALPDQKEPDDEMNDERKKMTHEKLKMNLTQMQKTRTFVMIVQRTVMMQAVKVRRARETDGSEVEKRARLNWEIKQ